MANVTGSSTAEIDAPLDQVWALVQDVESAPEWQGGLKGMHAIERDGDGRATLCEAETDAKVVTVKSKVRFAYDGPARLSWTQEQGDLKSVEGSWHARGSRRRPHPRDVLPRRRPRTEAQPDHPRAARRRAPPHARSLARRRAQEADRVKLTRQRRACRASRRRSRRGPWGRTSARTCRRSRRRRPRWPRV